MLTNAAQDKKFNICVLARKWWKEEQLFAREQRTITNDALDYVAILEIAADVGDVMLFKGAMKWAHQQADAPAIDYNDLLVLAAGSSIELCEYIITIGKRVGAHFDFDEMARNTDSPDIYRLAIVNGATKRSLR
jgi:hypothetical protein